MSEQFLREGDVKRLTGVSKSTRYEWIAKGEFPKPYKLSQRIAVWSSDEIAEWQAQQKARRG